MSTRTDIQAPSGTILALATDDGVLQPGAPAAFAGRRVSALRPRPGGGWTALVDGREVWAGQGGSWDRLASLDEGLTATALAAVGERILVGTSGARLFEVAGGTASPLQAFDEAPGRQSWYTPWGGPPDTRWIAAAPDGRVYVNVHVGGIVAAPGPGGPWSPTIDVDADVHQVEVGPGGRVLVACALGHASSDDGGATWTFSTEGLHGRYSRAVAVAGDHLLVTASTGPSTDRAAVYRRPLDGDGPFERCHRGLPDWFDGNVDTGQLTAVGDTAVLAHGGDLYASPDAGGSWERVASGLASVRAVGLAPVS